MENVWQRMRDNWSSSRVFDTYNDIAAHWCEAWDRLANQSWRIMSHRNTRLGSLEIVDES